MCVCVCVCVCECEGGVRVHVHISVHMHAHEWEPLKSNLCDAMRRGSQYSVSGSLTTHPPLVHP